MCSSGLGWSASTTWTRRSASTTTSSVDLNASTSWCGSFWTKPDGVGDEHRLAAGQVEAAGGGVEGGEEPVLHQHPGVGQPVEQGRLAGVGVADDGDGAQAGSGAGPCAGCARCWRCRGGRPRACGCDARGRRRSTSSWVSPGPRVPIPGGRRPAASVPCPCRAGVGTGSAAGQLDLGLALLAVGVLGEDVEDRTVVRSIAVRPNIFSRLNCWAGVSSLSNTTVSRRSPA